MGDIEGFLAIDTAIRNGYGIAVRHLPDEDVLRLTAVGHDAIFTTCDPAELNGKEGFVMAPFFASEECPIICMQAQEYELAIPEEAFPAPDGEYPFTRITTNYPKRFRRFITPIREGVMDTLMLSRRVEMEKPAGFSPSLLFLKACYRNPRSCVYLVHTPYSGTWLGCSPLPFLFGEGDDWQVSAVGGEQPLINGLVPPVWTERICDEQQMIADCVQVRLQATGLEWRNEPPRAVPVGNVAYLKADFPFTLPDRDCIGDLLKALYPTPIVCGLPCEDAYRFIIDREGYDRRYYSGFVGYLSPEGRSEIHLNLRCMEFLSTKLAMYVGSLLLPDSTPAGEWKETESQISFLRSFLD
ncbi:MAG: chorismate-binding protein [Tannerellaceae bacterium]|jgi:isochorismate synthase|nr:chorismate-binding protein [Tannerellaceae bacterium]